MATTHRRTVSQLIMRRILIDYAREREALKRPNGIRLTLDEGMRTVAPVDCELLMLDDALQALALIDERQAQIVELKYFGGLSEEEVAAVLSLSRATVTRVTSDGSAYFVNDSRIIVTDVFASNGVIHAIDKVLLPL